MDEDQIKTAIKKVEGSISKVVGDLASFRSDFNKHAHLGHDLTTQIKGSSISGGVTVVTDGVTIFGDGSVGNPLVAAGTPPGDPNNSVQFNSGGVFTGSADFTYTEPAFTSLLSFQTSSNGSTIILTGGDATFDSLGDLFLEAGDVTATGTAHKATFHAGNGTGSNVVIGGEAAIVGGSGSAGATGGAATLTGGTSTNIGGAAVITGGTGSGIGGSANVSGGAGVSTGVGGNITLTPGAGASTSANGLLQQGGTISSVTTLVSNRAVGVITTTTIGYNSVRDFFSPSTHSAGYIRARVVGHRTGGASGTTDDSIIVECVQGVKRGAGAPNLVGSLTFVFFYGDNATADVRFAVSGNLIQLQVQGDTNNNYSWQYEMFYMNV